MIVDRPELTQAQVRIASAGYPRSSPDYAAGLVAGAVLGGGFTSRLMEAVRVNRGLSYGVRSRFATSRAGGLFFFSSFTKVETAGELVQVALDEVARFREGGPTEEELERTRGYLCGLYPLGLETHEQWAEKLAEVELYGLAADEVTRLPRSDPGGGRGRLPGGGAALAPGRTGGWWWRSARPGGSGPSWPASARSRWWRPGR